jgi:hypothetical protein
MAKREMLIPWMEEKKARTLVGERMRAAGTEAKMDTFAYDEDSDAADGDEAECVVLRITDVSLPRPGQDLMEATAAVLWGDHSWTRVPVRNLMTTPEGCREVAR